MTSGGNVNFCLKELLIKVSTSRIYVKTVELFIGSYMQYCSFSGGGFRDSLADIAEELCPSSTDAPLPVSFFVRSPNQVCSICVLLLKTRTPSLPTELCLERELECTNKTILRNKRTRQV